MNIPPQNTENQNQAAAENAADNPNTGLSGVQVPSITLPTGGGAIKGIQEDFQVSSVTGTSSFSIPIPYSPARHGFTPSAGLTYSSGNGNSAFGLGWDVSVPSVTRSTRRRLPEYKDEIDSDVFTLDGAEDLVPKLEQSNGQWNKVISEKSYEGIEYTVFAYRPRIESAHARIERWVSKRDGQVHWQTINGDNVRSVYGLTAESRISDPADAARVFQWLLCYSHDDKGNIVAYQYKQEDFVGVPNNQYEKNRIGNCTQTYIKKIQYGNKTPYYLGDPFPAADGYLFETAFDYGEHDQSLPVVKAVNTESQAWQYRPDPFSSYRSGFEIRTYRRCQRILMFHCFEAEHLPHTPYLTKSLELKYQSDLELQGAASAQSGFSFLVGSKHSGYKWDPVENHYTSKSLPDLEISYQQHEWNTEVIALASSDDDNAAFGMGDQTHLWVDLFSEGITGVLTEREQGWYYKSNFGGGKFTRAEQLIERPSLAGLAGNSLAIQDLNGDGRKSLVHYDQPRGSFALEPDRSWSEFKPFEHMPNIAFDSAASRLMDVSGDGVMDLVLTEENRTRWFPGLGDKGFKLPEAVSKSIDKDNGPGILFEDREFSLFLADMSGDGLTDIVRIRNGSICYWPNLGYGRFGRKVSMLAAPAFDHPDKFNPAYLRLADIDGSGTTDLIYLGKNEINIWLNDSGNAWSDQPLKIAAFSGVNDFSNISVIDFLGSGTACLVYRTDLENHANAPLRYIDLMGSKKPGLMSGYVTNTGLESVINYKSSTHYYLEDQMAGKEWITTLPFPVHCVDSVRVEDKIRETVFTTSYRYRHGYFDSVEKEFRGFARVENLDTEEFAQFKLNNAQNVVEEALHQAPVKTITWFHTGAYLQNKEILHQCKSEYFQNTEFTEYSLPAPEFPSNLSQLELIEAFRAFKGVTLRTEVYSNDGSSQQSLPYSVTEVSVGLVQVQPRQKPAPSCVQLIPAESISYGYERNPADPRIVHGITLEVDDLGVVKKDVSVVYPRVKRPIAPNEIPNRVWAEQSKLHITYSEAFSTNDVIDDTNHRLRLGSESKKYELSGLVQPADFYIGRNQLISHISAGSVIEFDTDFSGGSELRLFRHTRSYFLKEDLSGPLPLGQLSSLGIPEKSCQLAYTNSLITDVYGGNVTDSMLLDAKYVHSEGDEHWWNQTGLPIYGDDPKSRFYIPLGERDVFGNESFVTLDPYLLLPTSSTNAMGGSVTAVNDYRTLSASLVTDLNLNRSAVESDELGAITKTALMGKTGSDDGDSLDNPTTRIEYELYNWKNQGKPNVTHRFVREQHGTDNTVWQESFAYVDGRGQTLLTKVQAQPGMAKKWNNNSNSVEEVQANPRWLANGRTVINNKGNSVKQYEPYFSDSHEFESELSLLNIGVSSTALYDPIGRLVSMKYPDGTFSKVEFGSWRLDEFDANDTVKESQWYSDRGSPDPALGSEPADHQQRAAWLAAKHHGTPSASHLDSLGRSFFQVKDYGGGKTTSVYHDSELTGRFSKVIDQLGRTIVAGRANLLGASIYADSAEKGATFIFQDVLGRLVKSWDENNREFRTSYDPLHRQVSGFVKEAGNEILFSHIVYGDLLPDNEAVQKNLKGRPFKMFEQSGSVEMKDVDFKGNVRSIEKKLTKDYKHAINWQALDGLTDLAAINLHADALLEDEVFSSSSELDALNRPVSATLPDNSVLKPSYDEANRLKSLEVQLRGQGPFIDFLKSQQYDAKGQREKAEYGNGLETIYTYDPQTFRLINLQTKKANANASQSLQNLNYTYDPVGNLVSSRDTAQQSHYFSNSVVNPVQSFEYDAIYQLIKATGREHVSVGGALGQVSQGDLAHLNQIPHPNQLDAVRNYSEQYEYDDCGNLLSMKHSANAGSWTRRYRYQYQEDGSNNTNRLHSTSLPGDQIPGPFSAKYVHDNHGNMTETPHLKKLTWNFFDQLTKIDLGGGGIAFYVFGMGGMRTRKVIERQGGKRIERIYLGMTELYREYQNNQKRFERSTLHVSDNADRIAQIDTKLLDTDNADLNNPLGISLIRYQFTNHLGSATLETDDNGNIISYEEYHPFGSSSYRVSKSGVDLSLKRYRFSGKETDEETGFQYFGGRFFAPWLGRWTSSDPMGFVDGVNLFRYSRNNPINFVDDLGYEPRLTNASVGAPRDIQYSGTRAQVEQYFRDNPTIRGTGVVSDSDTGESANVDISFQIRNVALSRAIQTGGDRAGDQFWQISSYDLVSGTVQITRSNADPDEAEGEAQLNGADGENAEAADGDNDGDGTSVSPEATVRNEGPARNTAVRRSNVDPNPTREGFKPANPNGSTGAGEHAAGEGLRDSPHISASENPNGAPDIEGRRYWIDIDKAREHGAEYLPNESVREVYSEYAHREGAQPSLPRRFRAWLNAQTNNRAGDPALGGEQESMFRGEVPGHAVETRGMRAAKGFGRGLMFLGIALTAWDLGNAAVESRRIGSAAPLAAETIRQAGAWGLGLAAGAIFAAIFAPISVPAILAGIAVSLVAGMIGYAIGDYFADPIYAN